MNPVHTIILLNLISFLLLVPHPGLSEESKAVPEAKKEEKVEVRPALAEIIPSAMDLSAKLDELKNKLKTGPNIADMVSQYQGIKKNLDDLSLQLQQLKDLEDYRYQKVLELKQAIERENDLLKKSNKPLRDDINQLESWRSEWLEARTRWKKWREYEEELMKEGGLEQLKEIFRTTSEKIGEALELITGQLETKLAMQRSSGDIQAEINSLRAEVDRILLVERKDALLNKSPPMFSSEYFAQFNNELWGRTRSGANSVVWLTRSFFVRQGWAIIVQVFLTALIIGWIIRNRHELHNTRSWKFISSRPVSAGIYLGVMLTIIIYDYRGAPVGWKLGVMIIGGIAFARLLSVFTEDIRKKRFIYGLIVFMTLNNFIFAISLPLPLHRLYITFASLLFLAFSLKCASGYEGEKESIAYLWAFRLSALFFGGLALVEIWGQGERAQFLFPSTITFIAVALAFFLFMYLIRAWLEWLIRTVFAPRLILLPHEADTAIGHSAFIFNTGVAFFLMCVLLVNWRIYDSFNSAAKGILGVGVSLGSMKITFESLILAGGIVYGSFIVSRLIQKLFIERELSRRRVERGVRLSISGLAHYALIFIGFLLGIFSLGFDLTKMTIVLSALGVGIGFGLQNIVNNFVCGITLLIERPVRVGDYIELDNNWAEIKQIGLRATTVQTFDYADIIVPNAELISNRVTNWTLSTRVVRVIIPVGVAYGSNLEQVIEILLACAGDNPSVAGFPSPQALFLKFGESALEFELRAWVGDADEKLRVTSDLHQEVCKRFREANIEIAFPQRDLHLRSVDKSVTLNPSIKPVDPSGD
jgi:small-conductance mechanosensitive channel